MKSASKERACIHVHRDLNRGPNSWAIIQSYFDRQADTRHTSPRNVHWCVCVACTVPCSQLSNCSTIDALFKAGIHVDMVDELITTGRPIVNAMQYAIG